MSDSHKFISILIYYDLVYDNYTTIKKLSSLLDSLVNYNYYNVYVLPIHCIEYHVIKAFGIECELKHIIVDCADYKETRIYKYNVSKRRASHEKFCKAALGELVPERFIGTCDVNNYCISKDDEVKLISTLPAVYYYKDGVKVVNILDVLMEEYTVFYKLFTCDRYMLDKFKTSLRNYFKLISSQYE